MEIIPIESGPVSTIGYLVADTDTRKSVIIDAPLDSAQFFTDNIKKRDLKLDAIFLTHSHWDHTADAPLLHEKTGAPIYIHKYDEYRITDPMNHSIFQLPFVLDPCEAQFYFEHSATISIGNLDFEILHTPGHTEGGVCIVNHKNRIVFAGDTLFHSSIGRTDLPGGSTDELLFSIKNNLLTLPDDYIVYSGHGPKTTIGNERKNNPFINNL